MLVYEEKSKECSASHGILTLPVTTWMTCSLHVTDDGVDAQSVDSVGVDSFINALRMTNRWGSHGIR